MLPKNLEDNKTNTISITMDNIQVKSSTLQIIESFIGFVEILDQSGVGLEESIINGITKNYLNFSKFRGIYIGHIYIQVSRLG